MVGVPAVTRSAAVEAYAAVAAEYDGRNHIGHGYTQQNLRGVAYAENEVPWWPLSRFVTVQAVMREGWADMWAEGPGGGHYENMRSTHFSQVGCGVFINSGEITIVQHFR